MQICPEKQVDNGLPVSVSVSEYKQKIIVKMLDRKAWNILDIHNGNRTEWSPIRSVII